MATAKKTAAPSQLDIVARDRTLAILDAPSWRPEKGDILTAQLVSVRFGGQTSEYGVYPILVYRAIPGYPFPSVYSSADNADGVEEQYVAFHAFHSIVKDRLIELKPDPKMEPIHTIKYSGHIQFGDVIKGADGSETYVELKGKSDYHAYLVVEGDGTDLTSQEFDWSTVPVKTRDDK